MIIKNKNQHLAGFRNLTLTNQSVIINKFHTLIMNQTLLQIGYDPYRRFRYIFLLLWNLNQWAAL
jgi:hypothetical protein